MMPKIKKLEKWPFLEQNHGLTSLEKFPFSTFWTWTWNVSFSMFWIFCFYSLERRFLVVKYRKRHFPGLYCLKKKVGKMAIFGPKPWVNVFGKMSIFRLFEFFCFYSLERRFFVVKYRKRHFRGLYCLKKESRKNGHFWTKTMG